MDRDGFRDECAVFGIYGHVDAAAHTALGLHALQHRGQEAAGITTCDGSHFHAHRELGLVGDIFASRRIIEHLPGYSAIGHTRYSTTGEQSLRNVQPLFADFAFGGLAIAHNGNLTNALGLRHELVQQGCIFQSTSDTEVIIHLMATSQGQVVDRMVSALRQVEGAYSVVALSKNTLIGVRDPLGVRPLVLGQMGNTHILASESCALDIIGATHIRDIEPGELVIIDIDGVKSFKPFPKTGRRSCIFEYVYFSRPDSVAGGQSIYEVRKRIGAELARESGVDADVVFPIPDSGTPSAIGYAAETGIPFELGIIRNHYIGRTFIEPTDEIRHLGVKLKHNANRAFVEGKRVVLIDDSIVRGITSKKIVEMMRDAGATEVHLRIASPPTTNSCFYGVDTPERDQLLAAQLSVDEMRIMIGADSLAFVSIDGLYRATGHPKRDNTLPQYCDACFTGDYPIPLTDRTAGTQSTQMSLLTESML